MSYCEHPHCSKPLIKPLNKAHCFLCSKSRHYHAWHHHRHHKKVHFGTLALAVVSAVGLIISNTLLFPQGAAASSITWDLNTASDYTYDSNKIEFSSGVAQLKTDLTLGNGTDGAITVSSNVSIDASPIASGRTKADAVNLAITNNIAEGATSISITGDQSAIGLATGDEVIIINMQGASADNTNVGKYDTVRLDSINYDADGNATTFQFTNPLGFGYDGTTQKVIMQRIPNYTDVTIANGGTLGVSAWDGTKGGLLFFRADGTVSVQSGGIVSANAKGYRAGIGRSGFNSPYCGNAAWLTITSGESYTGPGSNSAQPNGGGGGTSCGVNDGVGGSGGYGATGTNGNGNDANYRGLGGQSYGTADIGQIYLGSGAGGSANAYGAGAGGAGGGIVYIQANTLTVAGNIFSNGGNGANGNTAGSGGSGGSIKIDANNTTLGDGLITASGGNGGTASQTTQGKAGVVGRIAIYSPNAISGSTTPNYAAANTYPVNNPLITDATGQNFLSLQGFSGTLGSGSTGTIKYHVSNGSSWYWWNGSAWAIAAKGYSESSSAADINSHIGTFELGGGIFKWKAFFHSDGTQQPKLDGITLSFLYDSLPPDNPTLSSSKSASSGGVDIVSNQWSKYSSPYFTWDEPADNADVGESATGIAGYYVYFGEDGGASPKQTRGIAAELGKAGLHYQSDTDFEVGVDTSSLAAGKTYYLIVLAEDYAGNPQGYGGSLTLFTYKYDGDKPTNPQYVTASPSGYSSSKDFSFVWPTATSAAASDTGGSELTGYQYKLNSDNHWYGLNHTDADDDIIPFGTGTITLPEADYDLISEGQNTFYLRTLDNAGNVADSTIQVPFYYNASAPKAPTGLNVDPASNTANNFAFSWTAPANPTSPIAGYYYAVNPVLPLTTDKANYTADASIPAGPFATQQGENTFYVVAKDEAGNANLASCSNIQNNPLIDGCAKISFTANTPAPGIPTSLIVNDQSVRGVSYKISLSWSAPSEVGIGISHYNLYRKSGSGELAKISSPADRFYLDETAQAGTEYSYAVRAVDSANKESADSTLVSIKPKGKYESPARIVGGSVKTSTTSRTAEISWQTETDRDPYTDEIHITDSMVAYGKTKNLESTAADREMGSNHLISLQNLDSDTIYYYQVLGTDENGNKTEGPVLTFQTEKPTTITNVQVLDVRQKTAIIKWESSRITTTELLYGTSTFYGLTYKEGDSPNALMHTVFIKDLEPGTQYHFQIQAKDEFGDTIKSDNYELLETLPYPKIENITFQPLEKEAITTIEVAWSTNIPTDGRVKYASTDGSDWREEYDGEFKKDHKFTIGAGKLLDQKTYLFKAFVRDQYGNEATSENQSYTTPEDTRPPVISNLQTEVSIEGAGDSTKVSAVVTWDTDEPSDSQVFYGVGASGDFTNSTGKDVGMATAHLVVISDLKPAQTYHVEAKSSDKSGNITESAIQNFVTNQASQSVVSIILTRLQQTFGWMTSFNRIFGE